MSRAIAVFDRLPGHLEVMIGPNAYDGLLCSVMLTNERPTWEVPAWAFGREAFVMYRPQPMTQDEIGVLRRWRVRL